MLTCSLYEVTKVTGITTTMLRSERPLSVVFPLFIKWIVTTTAHVSDTTGTPHYPGKMVHNDLCKTIVHSQCSFSSP